MQRKRAGVPLRATPFKLGLFYVALCLSSGVATPYIAIWLHAHGLSGGEIGLILAAPMLARIATGPALAVWADGFQLRRTAILIMTALSALGYGALMATSGFWPWLLVWFVGATAYQICPPLVDVITLRRAPLDGFAYAVPRGMGSAAYIVANVVAGLLIPQLGPEVVVWWLLGAGLVLVIGAVALLPRDRVVEIGERTDGRSRLAGAGELIRDPVFMLMLVSVSLVQAAHGFYYAFSTLIWRAQGIGPAWSGALWGVGVAVEVVFLWFCEPLRRRLGPERLLIAGAAGAAIRWTAFAFSPPLWLLFPLQGLHALSFTATFIASLELTERLSPRVHASAAQSLNAGLSLGLMTGLATLVSGPLYDHAGAWGYLAMSASALLGLAGAVRLYQTLTASAAQPQSSGP